MNRQLRLSRPTKKVRTARLTKRQQNLLGMLRWVPEAACADKLGELLGYACPREACDRLVDRGLVEKVAPGRYRAKVTRERRT